MIAAATFIVAGALAWAHYALLGPRVGFGFTVWTAWFFSVLLAAGVDCWRQKDRELLAAWAVFLAGFFVAMMTWKISANPLVDLTLRNLIVMAALLLIAIRPETALPVLLHGAVIFAAFLASQGVIPTAAQRPRAFIAWSYPDVAAALQHLSLIILGGYGLARNHLLGWRHGSRYVAAASSLHRVARSPRP